jgi:hypothetical protein
MGKGLERSRRDTTEALFRHLNGWTEENHKNAPTQDNGVPAEIRTENIWNTNQELYSYAGLFTVKLCVHTYNPGS